MRARITVVKKKTNGIIMFSVCIAEHDVNHAVIN